MSGGMDKLKARWQGWSNRFAALQKREKTLIAAAVAVAILFGGYTLWVEPGQQQTDRLKKTLEQQQADLAQLQTQVAALVVRDSDPDSGNRSALQQLRNELVAMEREIKAFDGTLVAPKQAPALLQTLLARHRGLSLVSLTTLPPQPLIELPAAKAEKDGTRPAEKTPPMPGGNIYKHGIEIKLAGSYADLVAYVAELQASPQKMLWGGMKLTVKQHPVSELTLTIYTLSLDSTWLVV
ncbi:MAG: type II secretion system protein GspM [Rhodocyclaceae bacterium]|nr:type II secretion system protein GspM [Rhodocyclaceae bacterium]